jgi:hypothetical protein
MSNRNWYMGDFYEIFCMVVQDYSKDNLKNNYLIFKLNYLIFFLIIISLFIFHLS